jgi:hypothetical protein
VSTLPPRAQRVLALLVVPAALLAIWSSLLWPLLHAYQSQVEWRRTAAHTLARQRGLAAIEAAVQAQLGALPALNSWQRLYHLGTDSSAVIALQSDVSNALAASHARPQSFAPIAPAQAGPLRKVGLRVAASMTIDQLREFLRQTDELTHFVRIEHLTIVAPPLQTPPGTAKENPLLSVTLDVFGFAVEDAAVSAATSAQNGSR